MSTIVERRIPISVESDEYQKHLVSAQTGRSSVEFGYIFGLEALMALDHRSVPNIALLEKTSQELDDAAFKKVAEAKARLDSLDYSTLSKINSELKEHYSEVLPTSEDAEATPVEKIQAMDTDEFIAFLKGYGDITKERLDAFQQEVPKRIERYISAFEICVKRGLLPDVIDSIRNKIYKLKYAGVDIFCQNENVNTDQEWAGYFNLHDLRAAVRISHDQEDVFTHESTHGVAGRLAVKISKEKIINRRGGAILKLIGIDSKPKKSVSYSYINDRTSGLSQENSSNFMRNSRHRWLNEAVTEHVTQLLLNPDVKTQDSAQVRELFESGVYLEERELLATILERGAVPVNLFTIFEAYFEDYNPHKPKGMRAEKYLALHEEITKAYGPGFLVKLDAYIHELEKYMSKSQAAAEAAKMIKIDPTLVNELPLKAVEDGFKYTASHNLLVTSLAQTRTLWPIKLNEPSDIGEVQYMNEISLEGSFALPGGIIISIKVETDDNQSDKGCDLFITLQDQQIRYYSFGGSQNWMITKRETPDQPENSPTLELPESYAKFNKRLKQFLLVDRSEGKFCTGEFTFIEEILQTIHADYAETLSKNLQTIIK